MLVTFRRSGQPVPTPVWFGLHDGRLYVESLADAGKVKPLRDDRHVRVAPCTARGKPKGPFAEGVARILGAAEEEIAELALDRHYGLRRRLYVRLGTRLGVRSVYLELHPPASTAPDVAPRGPRSPPRPARRGRVELLSPAPAS